MESGTVKVVPGFFIENQSRAPEQASGRKNCLLTRRNQAHGGRRPSCGWPEEEEEGEEEQQQRQEEEEDEQKTEGGKQALASDLQTASRYVITPFCCLMQQSFADRLR